MHILVITPAGKTVKVEDGDEADTKDLNKDKLIPLDETKLLNKFPSTSEQTLAQAQELKFGDKHQKFPSRCAFLNQFIERPCLDCICLQTAKELISLCSRCLAAHPTAKLTTYVLEYVKVLL